MRSRPLPPDVRARVSAAVLELLHRLGSQKALAARLRLTKGAVSKLVHGKTKPELRLAARVESALLLPPEWFKPGSPKSTDRAEKTGPIVEHCVACGFVHDEATRRMVLRRMGDATNGEVREAYPCLFRESKTIQRARARMERAA